MTPSVGECDGYAGGVDLLRSGSDEQQCCVFDGVVCTSPPGPGGPGDADSDICERAVLFAPDRF